MEREIGLEVREGWIGREEGGMEREIGLEVKEGGRGTQRDEGAGDGEGPVREGEGDRE